MKFSAMMFSVLAMSAVAPLGAMEITTFGFKSKLLKKEDIEANMTTNLALSMLKKMKAPKAMLNSFQTQLSQVVGKSNLRSVKKHTDTEQPEGSGYSGVKKSAAVLGDMIAETVYKLEFNDEKCKQANESQWVLLEDSSQKVQDYKADSFGAMEQVLLAQAQINKNQQQIRRLQEARKMQQDILDQELYAHHANLDLIGGAYWSCDGLELSFMEFKEPCYNYHGASRDGLWNLHWYGDLGVMFNVIKMTDSCSTGDFMLMQCSHCHGKTVMMQHQELASALAKVTSLVAKDQIKKGLQKLYDAQLPGSPYPGEDAATYNQSWGEQTQFDVHTENTSDLPTSPVWHDCAKTAACTLGNTPHCSAVRDRFLKIFGGLIDEWWRVYDLIDKNHRDYWHMTDEFSHMIYEANSDVSMWQVKRSSALEAKTTNDARSHEEYRVHGEYADEYSSNNEECCADQNTLLSELCALKKIRAELTKIKGDAVFYTDCETSSWIPDADCTATCGGGTQKFSRQIEVSPSEGAKCPPLEKTEGCNNFACPIDCEMSDWQGWSACDAECGGGQRARFRTVTVEPKHQHALACDITDQTEVCDSGACDVQCELSKEWGPSTYCSRLCYCHNDAFQFSPPSKFSFKNIVKAGRGTGECPKISDSARRQETACNVNTCEDLIGRSVAEHHNPRKTTNRDTSIAGTLQCESDVDVTILFDVSANVDGFFDEAKQFLLKLIGAFDDSRYSYVTKEMSGPRISLATFGGPEDQYAASECVGFTSDKNTSMKPDCGIHWANNNIDLNQPGEFWDNASELATHVNGSDRFVYKGGSSAVNVAIREAAAGLMYGRPDKNKVTILVMFGMPVSMKATKEAVAALREKNQVVILAVGADLWNEQDELKGVATDPWSDNFVQIESAEAINSPSQSACFMNQLLSGVCPMVY